MAYALSTITILLSSIILFFALNKSYRLQESLADIYVPSTALLQKLSYQITETKNAHKELGICQSSNQFAR
jgi:hypothetical protein